MAEMKKNENRNVSHRRVENGYIIRVSSDWQDDKGNYKSESKEFIAMTAKEANEKINEFSKLKGVSE